MTDLTAIMAQGTMKAAILHAKDKGITNDAIMDSAVNITAKLREIMKAEWPEFMDTIKKATEANMGEPMYRQIMNTYCNSWAVKTLKTN